MVTWRNTLRWICVIPAGITAALLVTFPIHWLVMVTFGGYGVNPVIDIQDIKTIRNIESYLQSFFAPMAFIYFAARTAPGYRLAISVILALIMIVGLPVLVSWLNNQTIAQGSGILIEQGILRFIACLIGSVSAIFLIWVYKRDGARIIVKHEDKPIEIDHSEKNDKQNDYAPHKTVLLHILFIGLAAFSIFNVLVRSVFFPVLILYNAAIVFFMLHRKLINNNILKINFAVHIITVILLLVSLFNTDVGFYVAFIVMCGLIIGLGKDIRKIYRQKKGT